MAWRCLKDTSLWPFLWPFSCPFSSLNFWECLSDLKGFMAKNMKCWNLPFTWLALKNQLWKCILLPSDYYFKDSILSMFLWWHQSQLSSELKTCALQTEEQNVACDQFHLVISSILRNFNFYRGWNQRRDVMNHYQRWWLIFSLSFCLLMSF